MKRSRSDDDADEDDHRERNGAKPQRTEGGERTEGEEAEEEEDEYAMGQSETARQQARWRRNRDTSASTVAARDSESRSCPYLDTIRRAYLDFDFEKLCSVSLSNHNVYACLICGKYFQGRGKHSFAYIHSVHEGHHVFINLQTLKVYCLPDDYEVVDSSLDDIKFVLKPTFTEAQVDALDQNTQYSYDLNHRPYLPGFIGLNNIKANDYINVVVQALAHVMPLRNFFIREENYASCKSALVESFGELVRKIWNPRAFKGQVSPHEFIQAVSNSSKKRFRSTVQSDPSEFLSWFLNALHTDLGGTKRPNSSIVNRIFQGRVRVHTDRMVVDKLEEEKLTEEELARLNEEFKQYPKTDEVPYLLLTLELPPAPLFSDEFEKNIIPQVSLDVLLHKFDGVTGQPDVRKQVLRHYRLLQLPEYMILLIKRFSKNNWSLEKNPTIVNFPIKNIDLNDYIELPEGARIETKYDLVANIVHEARVTSSSSGGTIVNENKVGKGAGSYKIQLRNKGNEQWFEIQDLFVSEKSPQMIFLSESYIQIWERQKSS